MGMLIIRDVGGGGGGGGGGSQCHMNMNTSRVLQHDLTDGHGKTRLDEICTIPRFLLGRLGTSKFPQPHRLIPQLAEYNACSQCNVLSHFPQCTSSGWIISVCHKQLLCHKL